MGEDKSAQGSKLGYEKRKNRFDKCEINAAKA